MDRGAPFSAPLEALACAAALVDAQGLVAGANARWLDLEASPPIAGRRFAPGKALLSQGQLEPSGSPLRNIATLMERARAGGTPAPVMSACDVGGQRRWFETVVTRAGEELLLVVHHDVTHVRRVDAALREVLEQALFASGAALYRALARSTAHALGTKHALIGRLVERGGGTMRALSWWDGERFLEDVEYALDTTPCQEVLARGFCLFPGNVQNLFPNDRALVELGIHSYAGAPILGADGAALGHVVVMHDGPFPLPVDPQHLEVIATRAAAEIRRAEAEEELRRSQQQLERALAATHDGLFDWTVKTGAITGNPRLTEMLGFTPSELATIDDWERLVHPDDLPRVRDAVVAHFTQVTPSYAQELRVRAKDGSWRWILDRGTVVERDPKGNALRMTGLHTDITERKQLEAQVAAASRLASLGTLAAGLAHEINTPLTYLSAGLESLSRALPRVLSQAPPRTAQPILEALEISREGSERVRQIIRDIRAFARSGDEEARPTDVRQALAQALRMARHELVRRAQVVEALGEVPRVLAPGSRLGQVFLNLLVNAAHAIPEGAADQNEVRLSTFTDAQGRAVVEIRDTGCGIDPAAAAHVFEPFFTTQPTGEGTGLGLWICHQIVQRLHGEISFDSEPGKGTCFKVVLPPAVHPDAHAQARRARLLVVDDHAAVGASLKLVLGADYDVVTATSGAQAFALLEQGAAFDLVLCDLMMPETNGIDVYRHLSHHSPQLARKMVFMTGGAFTPELSAFVQSTENLVLEKPFPPEQVRSLLRNAVP